MNNPNFGAISTRNLLEKGCFRKVEKPNFPEKKVLIKRAVKLKVTAVEANNFFLDGKPIERFGPGGENEHDDEKAGDGQDEEGEEGENEKDEGEQGKE